jgi:hypothetical protein
MNNNKFRESYSLKIILTPKIDPYSFAKECYNVKKQSFLLDDNKIKYTFVAFHFYFLLDLFQTALSIRTLRFFFF